MLYELNCFEQRLISLCQRQLAVYNIPMRTQFYANHPNLNDLSYASFAVIQQTVVVTGGMDYLDQSDGDSRRNVWLIQLPKYSFEKKINKYQRVELNIRRGANLLQPRYRHSSLSDGMRYVHVLGNHSPPQSKLYEKYDFMQDTWTEGPELLEGGKNLSCCYFKSGLKEESLWVFHKSIIQKLILNKEGEIWKSIFVREYELLKPYQKQAMIQLNVYQILIFGGETIEGCKDIDEVFYLNVQDRFISYGPKLPDKILPENPGYSLNSYAKFYFLGNIGQIYSFDKAEKKWDKIHFESGSVF
ncbi:kelch motif family protein [Stylonychia lemnae]|uniref:Kelch motif family protein n=1 Tax=Stylonychia lemnae TaxID=5949 RepID=A0A078AJ32_STYLE|nr:kelch motif family protein [Stylonychia lemnae]|eukprot:CDW82335.1 kelch motif family protein [Stylonychia lemnae]